jgi:hypothetical protein
LGQARYEERHAEKESFVMTFDAIAKTSVTAALASARNESGFGSTRPELEARAVTQVMEMNTLGKDEEKEKKKGLGLGRSTYDAFGRLGAMTAFKRAGVSLSNLTSGSVDRTV